MTRLQGVGDVSATRRERVATMQRARRLASIAVVALTAAGGLSACRSEPDVAAYIGKSTITQARVDAVYADAERKLGTAVDDVRAQQSANPDPSAQPVPDEVKLPITRADVLTALVGSDVLGEIGKKRNVQPAEVQTAAVAQQLGLPADAEYVGIYAKYRGYLSALLNGAPAGQISNADLRQVYDRFKAGGGLGPNPVNYEDFSTQLQPQDRDALARTVGLRDQLRTQTEDLNLSVNPRYGVDELPLLPVDVQGGKSVNLIGLPLISGDPAVVDR